MSAANRDDHSQLLSQLLTLYDEFTEFNAHCAFFCDAVAALGVEREEWLDEVSAAGLGFQSHGLKERSAAIKRELDAVWHTARGDQIPQG